MEDLNGVLIFFFSIVSIVIADTGRLTEKEKNYEILVIKICDKRVNSVQLGV